MLLYILFWDCNLSHIIILIQHSHDNRFSINFNMCHEEWKKKDKKNYVRERNEKNFLEMLKKCIKFHRSWNKFLFCLLSLLFPVRSKCSLKTFNYLTIQIEKVFFIPHWWKDRSEACVDETFTHKTLHKTLFIFCGDRRRMEQQET